MAARRRVTRFFPRIGEVEEGRLSRRDGEGYLVVRIAPRLYRPVLADVLLRHASEVGRYERGEKFTGDLRLIRRSTSRRRN